MPSSEADSTACAEGANATAVTAAAWSAKVTKQKPEARPHTFTLASSAPVTRWAPSGEKAVAATS